MFYLLLLELSSPHIIGYNTVPPTMKNLNLNILYKLHYEPAITADKVWSNWPTHTLLHEPYMVCYQHTMIQGKKNTFISPQLKQFKICPQRYDFLAIYGEQRVKSAIHTRAHEPQQAHGQIWPTGSSKTNKISTTVNQIADKKCFKSEKRWLRSSCFSKKSTMTSVSLKDEILRESTVYSKNNTSRHISSKYSKCSMLNNFNFTLNLWTLTNLNK